MRWQYFVGLSLGRESIPDTQIARMVFAYLRQAAEWHGVYFPKLVWCLRVELGERTARRHLHVLIGGAPAGKVTGRWLYASKEVWRGIHPVYRDGKLVGAVSDCRLFDPTLEGVDYVLKGLEQAYAMGANLYELNKFRCGPTDLTLSQSLNRVMVPRRSIGQTGPPASGQSGVNRTRSVPSGIDQIPRQSPVRSAVVRSEEWQADELPAAHIRWITDPQTMVPIGYSADQAAG